MYSINVIAGSFAVILQAELGDRLMVGHIPLEDIILVRVQVSQLWLENQ